MNSTIPLGGSKVTFSIDNSCGVPVYRQLIQQVENAVISGKMKIGDKLPTIRALSVEMKINPNTIAKVYNELEIRGILQTQVGRGTFVSDNKPGFTESWKGKKIQEAVSRFLCEMDRLGVNVDEVIELIKNGCNSREEG